VLEQVSHSSLVIRILFPTLELVSPGTECSSRKDGRRQREVLAGNDNEFDIASIPTLFSAPPSVILLRPPLQLWPDAKLFQTPKTRLSLVGVVSLLLLLDALATLLETELLGMRLLGGLLPLGEVSLVGLGVRRVFTDLLVSLSVHVLDVLRRDIVSEPP